MAPIKTETPAAGAVAVEEYKKKKTAVAEKLTCLRKNAEAGEVKE